MYKHYDREEEEISNDCIDRERTHLNYNLAVHQTMLQSEFMRQRLSEVKVQNRKDVNVMCAWAITLPDNIPEGDEKNFFDSCYEFLENKYGKENVVSAYVHMDETTPHMHFAFIPVVYDPKKEKYKVSAKECITRNELKRFHSDLEAFLEPRLGYTPNILTGATREGNKSIQELKRHSAREIVQEAISEAFKEKQETRKEIYAALDRFNSVYDEIKLQEAKLKALSQTPEMQEMYPEEVKLKKKGLLDREDMVIVPKRIWEDKHKLVQERNELKKEIQAYDVILHDIRQTDTYLLIKQLQKEKEEFEKKLKEELEKQRKEFLKEQEELNFVSEYWKDRYVEVGAEFDEYKDVVNETLKIVPTKVKYIFENCKNKVIDEQFSYIREYGLEL